MNEQYPVPPPLPPQVVFPPEFTAEEVRRAHIGRERNIRALGLLFLVLACLEMIAFEKLGSWAIVVNVINANGEEGSELALRIIGFTVLILFLVFVVAATLYAGFGLRRLDGKARAPALVITGLLAWPLSWLLYLPALPAVYVFYALLSKKAKMVFSKEYEEIIRQTPQMKHRMTEAELIGLAVFAAFGCMLWALYVLFLR